MQIILDFHNLSSFLQGIEESKIKNIFIEFSRA